jgi:hypothetical protein
MRKKNAYKKPKHKAKTIIATVKILLTAAMLAVFGLIFYFAWKDGWEAVFAWFGGKYFCFFFIIGLGAAVASVWLITLSKNLRRFKDDDE